MSRLVDPVGVPLRAAGADRRGRRGASGRRRVLHAAGRPRVGRDGRAGHPGHPGRPGHPGAAIRPRDARVGRLVVLRLLGLLVLLAVALLVASGLVRGGRSLCLRFLDRGCRLALVGDQRFEPRGASLQRIPEVAIHPRGKRIDLPAEGGGLVGRPGAIAVVHACLDLVERRPEVGCALL
jgi:hypothetical protein